MDKKNIYSSYGEEKVKYRDKFTGEFEIKRILNYSVPIEQEMYYVTFKSGCITRPHIHMSEQILVATKGRGIVVIAEKADIHNTNNTNIGLERVREIRMEEGDVVCVPTGSLHWHGSAEKNKDFSHIAIRKKTDLPNIWL